MTEIESGIAEGRDAIIKYHKSIETNAAALQERTKKDENAILSSVQVKFKY